MPVIMYMHGRSGGTCLSHLTRHCHGDACILATLFPSLPPVAIEEKERFRGLALLPFLPCYGFTYYVIVCTCTWMCSVCMYVCVCVWVLPLGGSLLCPDLTAMTPWSAMCACDLRGTECLYWVLVCNTSLIRRTKIKTVCPRIPQTTSSTLQMQFNYFICQWFEEWLSCNLRYEAACVGCHYRSCGPDGQRFEKCLRYNLRYEAAYVRFITTHGAAQMFHRSMISEHFLRCSLRCNLRNLGHLHIVSHARCSRWLTKHTDEGLSSTDILWLVHFSITCITAVLIPWLCS